MKLHHFTHYEPIQFIAAAPGTRAVYYLEGETPDHCIDPVLFWAICRCIIVSTDPATGVVHRRKREQNEIHPMVAHEHGIVEAAVETSNYKGILLPGEDVDDRFRRINGMPVAP